MSTHHLETFKLNGSAILAKVLYVSCYLACLPKAFALNGSACWGKVLNVSCHLACLMSAYQMEAFELNDSICLGKGLNAACCPLVWCVLARCNAKQTGKKERNTQDHNKLNISQTKSTHRETSTPQNINKRAA